MTHRDLPALVHLQTGHGVARITLDSPHNRNALSVQLRRELWAHLQRVQEDNSVRVIVLGHSGTVFCAGADLKEAGDAGTDDSAVEFTDILNWIIRSPKPVVAQLEGSARAGGLGLVAACDIAIAARTATFGLSEVRLGLVAAVISVTVLPRMHSRSAQELFLTGETFDAARAVEVGLLTRAVDSEDVASEVGRYIEMLTRGAPGALASTKRMLATAQAAHLEDRFIEMGELSAWHFASEEGKEGVAAFVAKRPPAWAPNPTGS